MSIPLDSQVFPLFFFSISFPCLVIEIIIWFYYGKLVLYTLPPYYPNSGLVPKDTIKKKKKKKVWKSGQ